MEDKMKANKDSGASASRQIDAILKKQTDWRGERLAELRELVNAADPAIVEEVKWKKPSRPEGVPVWSYEGIICIGEVLKSAVRLTFPHGANVSDPKSIFNTRMDSKSIRAVDFHEEDRIDAPALKAIIKEAMKLNASKKNIK